MTPEEKIEVLGQSAQYDICMDCGKVSPLSSRARDPFGRWIYPAVMPDGKHIKLLKVLMTNACSNECSYCVNSARRNTRREFFTPEGLAGLFNDLQKARIAQGLFLSSAIPDEPDKTMSDMIKTVEIVRKKYRFDGYVHLKVLPGASMETVSRAAKLAQRVSINMEAPTRERLARIAPGKNLMDDIVQRMQWMKGLLEREDTKAKQQTTQFVVGAAEESDQEILRTVQWLYDKMDLGRAYYSAYQPPDDPEKVVVPPVREHRLYQSDFLIRKYGFRFEEIGFGDEGNLSLEKDPKRVWADDHPEKFPLEVNTAPKEELLRVPGLGPSTVRRLIRERKDRRVRSLSDLKVLGAVTSWAAGYVTLDGKRPSVPKQLTWFK